MSRFYYAFLGSAYKLPLKFQSMTELITIKRDRYCYLFDYTNKLLYPCSETEFSKFKMTRELVSPISEYVNTISDIDKKLKLYSEISRDDVIDSLANVRHVSLEITENCNLKCVYCCYGNLYKKEFNFRRHEFTKDKIIDHLRVILILRKERDIKTAIRISFYGGEPLLRFDIIKACVDLSHQIQPDVDFSYGLTTNGLLLSKHIDYFVDNRFFLLISIDGGKENNSYRVDAFGNESFDQVHQTIESIYQNHHEYFETHISFSTVLHNKNNCIDTTDFFAKWNKRPSYGFVSTINAKRSHRLKEISKSHNYTNLELTQFKEKYPDAFKELFPYVHQDLTHWDSNSSCDYNDIKEVITSNKFYYPGKSCFLFANKVFVTVNGDLLPCERISRKFLFAN